MTERAERAVAPERVGRLRATIDRNGMGVVYAIDIDDVRVWTWAAHIDGPMSREAMSLFSVLGPKEIEPIGPESA